MKNPLLKNANGFDTPAGTKQQHYKGYYPEAIGGGWNPSDGNDLASEYSSQLGGYAAGTRGADKTQGYIDSLYRGTQEPPAPKGSKAPNGVPSVRSASSKTASDHITRQTYPIHFAVADALGGTVVDSWGPVIKTPHGKLHINVEPEGGATIWNEETGNESNVFDMDDEQAAVEAALDTIPNPPEPLPFGKQKEVKTPISQKDKKLRKVPEFSEEDKIRLHGIGVQGALKPIWDKAIRAGMLELSANRYSFTKEASSAIRSSLRDTVAQVNCALNRRHVPKNASAHEAAVKEIAKLVATSNQNLDEMGRIAKKAAKATHILYDAGPQSYTVRVMRGNNTIDEYNNGNSPWDSTTTFNRTDNDAIEYKRLLGFAKQTAMEYAQEYGVPENMVSHNEDLMAEEREDAGMDFTDDDRDELKRMGIRDSAKPKCPHCGSSKYGLMPTDFETAKCDDCGKNWEHGIVDGINNPYEKKAKTASIIGPLYHGTTASFTDFLLPDDVPGLGEERGDIGIHFGTEEQAEYRVEGSENARIIEVTLNVNKILRLADMNDWIPSYLAKVLLTKKFISPETRIQVSRLEKRGEDRAAYRILRKALDEAGYDAIAYENEIEGEGLSYVVWEPSKIKVISSHAKTAAVTDAQLINITILRLQHIYDAIKDKEEELDIDAASLPDAIGYLKRLLSMQPNKNDDDFLNSIGVRMSSKMLENHRTPKKKRV